MRYSRNSDKKTDRATVEANIVDYMREHRVEWQRPVPLSACGYAGFKGYKFRWPQGAALAVSRIVRDMVKRRVLGYRSDAPDARGCAVRGYYLRG